MIVKQKMKTMEMLTDWESKNKYDISDGAGQELFKATENSDTLERQCFGAYRAFEMMIEDLQGNVHMCLTRPFDCCSQQMEVCSPPGNPIGSINQEWTMITPRYTVKDQGGNVAFIIEGPNEFCICGCGNDVEFIVYTPDGSTQVGKISKKWTGLLQEAWTDYDVFGISFPVNLDVTKKALLLGATFLIDYNFFERSGDGKSQNQSQTILPKVILLLCLIAPFIVIFVFFFYGMNMFNIQYV